MLSTRTDLLTAETLPSSIEHLTAESLPSWTKHLTAETLPARSISCRVGSLLSSMRVILRSWEDRRLCFSRALSIFCLHPGLSSQRFRTHKRSPQGVGNASQARPTQRGLQRLMQNGLKTITDQRKDW